MNGISRDPDGAARIVPGLTYMRFDLIYGSVLQNEQNCPRTGTFLLLTTHYWSAAGAENSGSGHTHVGWRCRVGQVGHGPLQILVGWTTMHLAHPIFAMLIR